MTGSRRDLSVADLILLLGNLLETLRSQANDDFKNEQMTFSSLRILKIVTCSFFLMVSCLINWGEGEGGLFPLVYVMNCII